jgi:hypothetical protein
LPQFVNRTAREFPFYGSHECISPFILCLSAARDVDIAGEVHRKIETGAFTTYLLEHLENNPFDSIINQQNHINRRLRRGGYDQVHVVSSSHVFHEEMSLHDFLHYK